MDPGKGLNLYKFLNPVECVGKLLNLLHTHQVFGIG